MNLSGLATERLLLPALACASLLPATGMAQDLPTTQIWLAPVVEDVPGEPVLISAGSGYNNQPHFSADSQKIYFTAEQPGGQTDIWVYDLKTASLAAVNHSPESEYSPTPVPGRDAVSVIRVERDQRQRLWQLSLADGQATLLMPNVEPVGYHAWFTDTVAALFILGEPVSLHTAEIGEQLSIMRMTNIGRTLRRSPGHDAILLVDKNPKPWRIAAFDMDSGVATSVMPLFPGVEDFDVDTKNRFWSGSGSKLYRSNAEHTRWQLLADLRDYQLLNVSRLAVSPDGAWLAIVNGP